MLGECQRGRNGIIRTEHVADRTGWKPLVADYQLLILLLYEVLQMHQMQQYLVCQEMTGMCQRCARNARDVPELPEMC